MQNRRALVHVVRDFGGLTEPFIWQRVTAPADGLETQLWYERTRVRPPLTSRQIGARLITPGSLGDRVFHRVPALALPTGRAYRAAERNVRPAIIHAHYATTGVLVGVATRAPLVVSAYGFDVSVLARRRAWRAAYRRLARRAAAVLVEGPFMKQSVVGLGFDADQVRIVPIAADLDAPMPEPLLDGDGFRLLMCGRLVEKKGHAIGIRAFRMLRHELPAGATLEIVGGGPLEDELRGLVNTLGLGESVVFHGAMPRDAFRGLLASTDLFLAPSVTSRNGDSEGGAPTTILDAQAVGSIVVASRHADIPSLVQDDVTGYLADEGSVPSLANAIRRALAGTSRWPEIIDAARSQVHRTHSDVAVARALADVYKSVLDR